MDFYPEGAPLEYLWFVDLWRDIMSEDQKRQIENFWDEETGQYRTDKFRTDNGEIIALPRIRDVFDGVSELTTPPTKAAKRDPWE
jgi:hypothetical protein